MILETTAACYDHIREYWERPQVSRRISLILMVVFCLAGVGIFLNSLGLMPAALAPFVPTDPFYAIRLAFSLILGVEVLELIFAISDSVSLAVGKQLEIMALLLLRESFTDISLLPASISLENDWFILMQVGSTAVAGLLLFSFRRLFERWHCALGYGNVERYICSKKCISLFLLLTFFAAGGYDLYNIFLLGGKPAFFHIFYTALIFTDILLVLVGQYFAPSFQATFRNSGYAVSTLLMRIAIGSPHHIGALLCVFAGLYLLSLAWLVSRFTGKARKAVSPPPVE